MTALNLGIQKSGNPEIWDHKKNKSGILRMQILSAENVGKVLISTKKNLPASFGATSGQFPWAGKMQNLLFF